MLKFFSRLLKREKASKDTAVERLRLILVADRVDISPHIMDMMKEDLIEVITRYVDIDQSKLSMSLEKEKGIVALTASVPIKQVKREALQSLSNKIESGEI